MRWNQSVVVGLIVAVIWGGSIVFLGRSGQAPGRLEVPSRALPVGHGARIAAHLITPDGRTPVDFVIVTHDGGGWHAFSDWDPGCPTGLQVLTGIHGDFIKDPCLGTDWDLSGMLLAGPPRPALTPLPVDEMGAEVVVNLPR